MMIKKEHDFQLDPVMGAVRKDHSFRITMESQLFILSDIQHFWEVLSLPKLSMSPVIRGCTFQKFYS